MTVTVAEKVRAPVEAEAGCAHERGHIVDSSFYGHGYATDESRRVFCDVCRFQRWLDVEAALALAQGELGIIPTGAAESIAATAQVELIDLDAVRDEVLRSRHSLVGLLHALQAACPGETGQYVHYGATTQDIQDTAQSLEMRDVLDRLELDLRGLVGALAELAEEHAATPAVGRTHARPALPISFGLKVASWVDELLRHAERVEQARRRVLVAELFGGTGTLAGFGPSGRELVRRFAVRLGLAAPDVGWHTARDRVVEFVVTVAAVAGTAARIADEIRSLSQPEFGEVEESWTYGVVGSSTMPHKRNPERCEQVVVLAKLAAAQVGVALAGMGGDHERDSRALRVEWACVPDVSHYALAACAILTGILDGLQVDVERMRRNLDAVADEVASEALMLVLGERLGKQSAHALVYELSQTAFEERRPLRELVRGRTELDEETLDRLFDPTRYLGESAALALGVVERARRWLAAA